MTVCIQYTQPISGKNENEIFGLDVAINNFLSAYFRYSNQHKFLCRPTDSESFEVFRTIAKAAGVDADQKCVGLDPRYPQHNLGSVSCLFRPDPLIADFAWRRQQVPGRGYVACGLVHTMSGERIARTVGDLCIAPMTPSDALICPSASIRDAVQNLWQIYSEYLNYHFGGKYQCPVQTPVIPLGIDTQKFIQRSTPELRQSQRAALGVKPDEIVILFVGRLSFATKSHPLPLFMAAEKAAQRVKRKIRLVMYGYFKPSDMEEHFRLLAKEIAHTVQIDFIMNDDARFPQGLWACADIFSSLSENIQESFGLTPVEAMACGIPTVITDWDGYRGSVRDDIDGFLIPTVSPPPQAGMAVAEYYYNQENYGISLIAASQSTGVDIERCADAFVALAENDNKRRQFSQNAQRRALDTFDWKIIIKSYEDLWEQLYKERCSAPVLPVVPRHWQAAHPSYPNPWQMFKSFPSHILTLEDKVHVTMSNDEVINIMKHDMNYVLPELLITKDSMIDLIDTVRRCQSPLSIGEILSPFPHSEHNKILRCIGWMLKHGTCSLGG